MQTSNNTLSVYDFVSRSVEIEKLITQKEKNIEWCLELESLLPLKNQGIVYAVYVDHFGVEKKLFLNPFTIMKFSYILPSKMEREAYSAGGITEYSFDFIMTPISSVEIKWYPAKPNGVNQRNSPK